MIDILVRELYVGDFMKDIFTIWLCSDAYCGVGGNEEVKQLSKMGNKLASMSCSEAKAILRNSFRTEWWQHLNIRTVEESIHQLDRRAQVFGLKQHTVSSSPTTLLTYFTFVYCLYHLGRPGKKETSVCCTSECLGRRDVIQR